VSDDRSETWSIVELRINKAHDPDRSKLRALLETEFNYERMRTARILFVHLVGFSSVVIWLGAGWPGLFSDDARFFALTLWAAAALVALFAAIEELIWHRKLARLTSEQQGW
jgi:hypothetical protein